VLNSAPIDGLGHLAFVELQTVPGDQTRTIVVIELRPSVWKAAQFICTAARSADPHYQAEAKGSLIHISVPAFPQQAAAPVVEQAVGTVLGKVAKQATALLAKHPEPQPAAPGPLPKPAVPLAVVFQAGG
jgi:hypothetical protein